MKFTKNSFIYYNYQEKLGKYFVVLFEKVNNITPSIFLHKTRSTEEVLLLEKSFAVYKDGKLLYFQEFEEKIDEKEILFYAKENLGLKSPNFVNILNKSEKNLHKFIKPIKGNSFKWFLFYLSFLLATLVFFVFTSIKEDNINEIKQLQKKFRDTTKNLSFDSLTIHIINIKIKAKNKGIDINKLFIKNSMVLIEFEVLSKGLIYDFLNIYNSSIDEIKYDEATKRYRVNASFQLPRV